MMDTMAAISDLLTEFNARKQTITNVVDRSAFVKDIDCLDRAWNSGNAGDAKKHATNVQKFAMKYKTKFTDRFWQTIESISSGDSVPQKGISSTRLTSKYSRRGSEETATSKGSTTKQPVKNKPQHEKEQERAMEVQGIKSKAQQLQRLSQQVSYENRQYEKLEKEEDELLSRLSEQLSQEKKLFGKIDVEKDEFLNRLSQQLSEEKNKYEQLRNEKKEIHNRLSHQLSHEQKRYIALKTDRDEKHRRLSNQLSDEKSKFRALKTENDDMYQSISAINRRNRNIEKEKDQLLNRLSLQLSEEKEKYEQLKKEKEELHNRLSLQLSDKMKTYSTPLKTEQDQIHQRPDWNGGMPLVCWRSHEKKMLEKLEKGTDELLNIDGMVSGRKAKDDEQQQCDDMLARRKPTCEGRQETDDMVAGRKPTCEGRQEIDNDAHNELSLIRRLLKPICDEVLNADTDGMETIQMIECLGKCLKERIGR